MTKEPYVSRDECLIIVQYPVVAAYDAAAVCWRLCRPVLWNHARTRRQTWYYLPYPLHHRDGSNPRRGVPSRNALGGPHQRRDT